MPLLNWDNNQLSISSSVFGFDEFEIISFDGVSPSIFAFSERTN